MQSVYRHYEENLRDVIDILRRKGMTVVLSTVPVNLRHSAPFSSLRDPNLSERQTSRLRALQAEASQGLAQAQWRSAASALQAALEIDPGHADSHFQLATAYEGLQEYQLAKSHYQQALDLDALRFRADTRINRIIREVAAGVDRDRIRFIDSAAAFERASQPYQPGWDLLVEHVHYDFQGNYILAAEIAGAIREAVASPGQYQPLAASEVAARIGYPNHETIEVMKNLQGMVQNPPFTGQSNYAQLLDFVDGKIDAVTEQVGSPAEVIRRRRPVVQEGHADWKLHFELAELNRYVGDREAMYWHLSEVFRLYPHNRDSYLKMAEALARDGKWQEQIPYLQRSLYYTRGDEQEIAETLGRLATAHFKIQDNDTAVELLLGITRDYPDQVGMTLMAYGNLIRYARDAGLNRDIERYTASVQAYAQRLVREGKDQQYPLLYRRMSQIMTMAGDAAEARRWAQAQPG